MPFGFGLGVQESLFRSYSVSYANAKGIWQMQWAGRKYGLRGGDYFDIPKSTQKQLEYLRDLVKNFAWNLELVLVDYNYGPGRRFARYRSDKQCFSKDLNTDSPVKPENSCPGFLRRRLSASIQNDMGFTFRGSTPERSRSQSAGPSTIWNSACCWASTTGI